MQQGCKQPTAIIAAFGHSSMCLLVMSFEEKTATPTFQYLFPNTPVLNFTDWIMCAKKLTSDCKTILALGFANNFVEIWDISTEPITMRKRATCPHNCLVYALLLICLTLVVIV